MSYFKNFNCQPSAALTLATPRASAARVPLPVIINMEKSVYAFLLLLLVSCGERETKKEPTRDITTNNTVDATLDEENAGQIVATKGELPQSFLGYYINSKYLESLKRTWSTKQSQEVSRLSMVEITRKGQNSFLRAVLNFHEGGDNDTILMASSNQGIVVSSYDNSKVYDLIIKPNGTIVLNEGKDTYELVKFEPSKAGNEAQASIVNQTLFEGNYMLGNKPVRFTRDGKIIGIDSLSSYIVNTDYIDAGMAFDKVYFKNKTKKYLGYGDEYGFEFRNDTLEVFRLDCLAYRRDDPEFCEDHARGIPAYVLVKK
jgi:hypothetical protein